MRRLAVITLFALLIVLLLATTQALALPAAIQAKSTHQPHSPSGGTAGPGRTPGAQATAHAGLHGRPQILRGMLTATDASGLIMALPDGSSVAVGLTPDTKIHIPGGHDNGASLQSGMQVMVMAFTDQASNALVARM